MVGCHAFGQRSEGLGGALLVQCGGSFMCLRRKSWTRIPLNRIMAQRVLGCPYQLNEMWKWWQRIVLSVDWRVKNNVYLWMIRRCGVLRRGFNDAVGNE